MNRFFRTAYATTLSYLFLTLVAVLIVSTRMPFSAFSCLYFGLFLVLLPGAAPKRKGKKPTFLALGALVALLGFLPLVLFKSPLLFYAVHAAGIALAAVFLTLLRHRTTHSDFKAKYHFTVILLLLVIGFVYLALLAGVDKNGLIKSFNRNTVQLALNTIVPLAITLLVTGVLLLRGLRAQEGVVDERTFNRRQIRDTLIFAAVVSVVFAVDPFPYLKQGLFFIINNVIRPAAGAIARGIARLMNLISCTPVPIEEMQPTPEPTLDPEGPPLVPMAEAEPERYYIDDGPDLALTMAYIFLAAAAITLLAILAVQIVKLVKKLKNRNKKRGRGYPHETREALDPKDEPNDGEKPRKRSDDPRERMRYLYGEFLRHLRRISVAFDRSNTCGEIRNRAQSWMHVDSDDISDFTDLYEQARYREKENPTDADAHRMKTLLGRIKKR
ncbi:MAG: DUF4129 domain-containing protein [Clostridia bacterium]|nr:DUF4129 domain-containing protein [Clostridia bacterium]